MASIMVENKDTIIALFKSGMKQCEIAEKYHISRSSVRKWLLSWGVTEPKPQKPKVDEEDLPEFVMPRAEQIHEMLMENAILAKPIDKTPKPHKAHGKWYHDVTESFTHEYD